ncbi:CLUMA_CG007314, isoform A [Clunio marinus]|uniref:CLUMA_CG007314, isoform A n=1 Tax=Clunio marinus TaxID=568069 RepID=A0A1J1I5X6_9DIPT|nr:CLUMA_CG007314, isoform A [Clunio marinus]
MLTTFNRFCVVSAKQINEKWSHLFALCNLLSFCFIAIQTKQNSFINLTLNRGRLYANLLEFYLVLFSSMLHSTEND